MIIFLQALEVAIQEAPHVQFTPQIIGTDLSVSISCSLVT